MKSYPCRYNTISPTMINGTRMPMINGAASRFIFLICGNKISVFVVNGKYVFYDMV